MGIKRNVNQIFKVLLSLFLGGAILYWMYRNFSFESVKQTLLYDMDWKWMILSFPFGILAQAFRGWRWRQTLEPVGEKPRRSVAVNSIFISYAASLIIPRIGEFARCGILKKFDDVSFPKALGTVVTERAIDSVLVLFITGLTFWIQFHVFDIFFQSTGTRLDEIFTTFTSAGWLVTAICGIAIIILLLILVRKMSIYNNVKSAFKGLWQGVTSIKSVKNIPLFIFFTLAIWGSYFLHYYLTFFCFDATQNLGISCAIVTFIVGSIAVLVPTPNGAGPWHFAVKTMLILYGVNVTDALNFVLIVHSIQTLLVIVLGIYAWIALCLTKSRAASISKNLQ